MKRVSPILLLWMLILALVGCQASPNASVETASNAQEVKIEKNQKYYAVKDVALYIHLYGALPPNYISKKEANQRGWKPDDQSGLVVGGDRFGNREGRLPKKSGRQYFEADIQAGYGKNRGPERLVFSNDGYVFHTTDHYDSFEQLYSPEDPS